MHGVRCVHTLLFGSIVVLTTHRGYIMLRAGAERLLRLLSRQVEISDNELN